MRIIALRTLRAFWEQHPDVAPMLQAWYHDAKQAVWRTPADIKRVYRNASLVGHNRVVFNIKGNDYRLVVVVQYQYGVIYVRFVGTHQEYDRIDAAKVCASKDTQMDIRPIRNETDYEAALAEIERLFDASPNTPDGDRLDVLTTLVEAYEDQHYSIPTPDPIEAIKYWMESRGLTRADLEPYIGSRARVAEVLNHKRPLSLAMIRRLYSGLGIPASVLVQPYAVTEGKAVYKTTDRS